MATQARRIKTLILERGADGNFSTGVEEGSRCIMSPGLTLAELKVLKALLELAHTLDKGGKLEAPAGLSL